MEGGLLTKTYFLAGRAVRISGNGAMAVVTAPARAAAWAKQQVVSSARLLNPFRRKRRKDGRRSRKIAPARAPAPETRLSKGPRDTTAVVSAPEAPKQAPDFPDTLRRLRAEIGGMDPTSEVAMVKVVANIETMLYKLTDTAPLVSRILKTALDGLMQVASGEIVDTGRAMSEIARNLEKAERRLAGEEDTEAQAEEVSRTSLPEGRKSASHGKVSTRSPPQRHAAPPEVTQAEAAAAEFEGSRDRLVFCRALEDMSSREEIARTRAIRTLGGIHHDLSARAISARLVRDPSAEVRMECVNALAGLGKKEALPSVESALSDASASVRLAAVRGVYGLAGPEAAASLVRMFSDKNEDVRRRAVACAGWLGQEHLAAELVPLLKDECSFVRRAALEALTNIKATDSVDEIIELLDDPDESVGKKAFETLEAITGKQMTEAFPDDEYGRQLLIARWRTWRGGMPWLRGS